MIPNFSKNEIATLAKIRQPQEIILPINGGVLENATTAFISTINAVVQMADSGSVYPLIQWSFFLPYGWAGRKLDFWIRWTPSTTGSGDVKFNISIIRVVEGSDLPVAVADDIPVVSAAPGVANRIVLAKMNDGDLSSFSPGDSISLRFSRYAPDVADTYTGTAYIHSVKARVR